MKELRVAAQWWADRLRNKDSVFAGHPSEIMKLEHTQERAEVTPNQIDRFEERLFTELQMMTAGKYITLELFLFPRDGYNVLVDVATRLRIDTDLFPNKAMMSVRPGFVAVKMSLWDKYEIIHDEDTRQHDPLGGWQVGPRAFVLARQRRFQEERESKGNRK
jgi:hypothetical protein